MTVPAADAAYVAQVLRAQGHDPDAEDVARVVRVLAGELTIEEAYAEVDAELGMPSEHA